MLSAANFNCCLLTGEVMQCRFQAIWSSGMAFLLLQSEAVKKPGPDRRAASDLWALSSQHAGLCRPFLHKVPFAEHTDGYFETASN